MRYIYALLVQRVQRLAAFLWRYYRELLIRAELRKPESPTLNLNMWKPQWAFIYVSVKNVKSLLYYADSVH